MADSRGLRMWDKKPISVSIENSRDAAGKQIWGKWEGALINELQGLAHALPDCKTCYITDRQIQPNPLEINQGTTFYYVTLETSDADVGSRWHKLHWYDTYTVDDAWARINVSVFVARQPKPGDFPVFTDVKAQRFSDTGPDTPPASFAEEAALPRSVDDFPIHTGKS